jgi:hypothetical protein
MDERVTADAAGGMCVAGISFVQVQLTEFETDDYPLVIQDNRHLVMTSDEISVSVQPASGGKTKINLSIGRSTRLDRRSDEKLFRPSSPVIGANTLSIIGQIEPGRTVRLYRQIH